MTAAKKKMTLTEAQQGFQKFLNKLAKTYGPGKHISAAQAAVVYESDETHALWRNFAKNYSYKIGHGKFRVSTKILPLKNAEGLVVAKV